MKKGKGIRIENVRTKANVAFIQPRVFFNFKLHFSFAFYLAKRKKLKYI